MFHAADLDTEPGLEEKPQHRSHDRFVEMRIEPELVDAVITGKPVPQEIGDSADLLRELVAGLFSFGSGARGAPVLIDFGDDGGDLVGRRPGTGFGEERGMLTRRLRALSGAALRRRTT